MEYLDPVCSFKIDDDEVCGSSDVILLSAQVRGTIGQVIACPEHVAEAGQALCECAAEVHKYGFELIEQRAIDSGIAFGGF